MDADFPAALLRRTSTLVVRLSYKSVVPEEWAFLCHREGPAPNPELPKRWPKGHCWVSYWFMAGVRVPYVILKRYEGLLEGIRNPTGFYDGLGSEAEEGGRLGVQGSGFSTIVVGFFGA